MSSMSLNDTGDSVNLRNLVDLLVLKNRFLLLQLLQMHFLAENVYWCIIVIMHTVNVYLSTYTVSQKSDTDVAHYNFKAHQPILVIFGRDVAERVCYQMVICYPTCPN